MAKTRSQTGHLTIKKKEDNETKLPLSGASNRKVAKRQSPKHKNSLPAQQLKLEEDTDTKFLLKL
jgi:hypothetical protein